MLDALIKDSEQKMNKAAEHVDHELDGLRTGRASIHVLDGILIPIYGTDNPINQIATVSTPDGSTIAIQPWDKGAVGAIEKAILAANIGLTPSNDGKIIRLHIPPMTEETRKDAVKRAHTIAEDGRIAIRNVRRHVNDEIKKAEKAKDASEDDAKKLQSRIQKITDDHIKIIDGHAAKKEAEIMKV
jgi:ribosome recycling factor